MVILALSFLTPYFAFIPKASLAAVIICAVIFMIELEVVKPMWRSSKKDLIPTFATFFLCLAIGVEYGIVVGVVINIFFLLYPSARPTLDVEKKTVNYNYFISKDNQPVPCSFLVPMWFGILTNNTWKQPLLPSSRFHQNNCWKGRTDLFAPSSCNRLQIYFRG